MPSVSQRSQNLGTEHAFLVLAEVNERIDHGHDVISFAIGQPDFATPKISVTRPSALSLWAVRAPANMVSVTVKWAT